MASRFFCGPSCALDNENLTDLHLRLLFAVYFLKPTMQARKVFATLEQLGALIGIKNRGRLSAAMADLQAWGLVKIKTRRGCKTGNEYTLPELKDRFLVLPSAALSANLPRTERRLLFLLYSYRNHKTGTARPKIATLAERMGIKDHKRIIKATAALVKAGWLTKKRIGHTAMIYRLAGQDSAAVANGPARQPAALRVITGGAGNYSGSTTKDQAPPPPPRAAHYPESTTAHYPESTTDIGPHCSEVTTTKEQDFKPAFGPALEGAAAVLSQLQECDFAAAELIAANAEDLYPLARKPNLTAWAVQLMREREAQEARTDWPMLPGDLLELLHWALAHPDWTKFIRSPQAFIRNIETMQQSQYIEATQPKRRKRAGW